MKNYVYSILLLVLFFNGTSTSTVLYVPLKELKKTIWEADSLFLGASLKVKDSTKNVKVIYKKNHPRALGILYFMVPGFSDSARFIFHNKKSLFPEEQDTINLGKFPVNTPVIFMYSIIDTCKLFEIIKNKRVYTGQNRDSIDMYISEISGPFGKKCAVAGMIISGKCEVGFAAEIPGCYRDIRFEVDNAEIVR